MKIFFDFVIVILLLTYLLNCQKNHIRSKLSYLEESIDIIYYKTLYLLGFFVLFSTTIMAVGITFKNIILVLYTSSSFTRLPTIDLISVEI